jgi:hypothetical protein
MLYRIGLEIVEDVEESSEDVALFQTLETTWAHHNRARFVLCNASRWLKGKLPPVGDAHCFGSTHFTQT